MLKGTIRFLVGCAVGTGLTASYFLPNIRGANHATENKIDQLLNEVKLLKK